MMTFRRGGLCVLAALQHAPQNYGAPYSFFLFFFSPRPACCRQAQKPARPPRRTGGYSTFLKLIVETFISFVSFILIIIEFY
jgi:hypothetical protein